MSMNNKRPKKFKRERSKECTTTADNAIKFPYPREPLEYWVYRRGDNLVVVADCHISIADDLGRGTSCYTIIERRDFVDRPDEVKYQWNLVMYRTFMACHKTSAQRDGFAIVNACRRLCGLPEAPIEELYEISTANYHQGWGMLTSEGRVD